MSMFKYTHEMILNSLTAEDGTEKARAIVIPTGNEVSSNFRKLREDLAHKKDEKGFSIQRFGEYKTRNVVGQRMYKTPGVRGKRSVMTIDCDGLIAKDESGVYEAGLYNFTFSIKMPNRFYGEYAHPNYMGFFKPVMIGFEVSPVVAADGTKLASLIARDLNLVIPTNNKFVYVKAEGSKVILTIPDVYGHFGEYMFERYDPTMCDSCLGEYSERDITDKVTIEDGVEPFCTGQWLIENYRFPSYPNVRYAALNEDEYPIADALYTQYSFVYEVHRIGFGGISSVGQDVSATTNHILFVENNLVEDFEKVIKDAGIDIIEYEDPETPEPEVPVEPTPEDKKVVVVNAASISKAQGSVQLTADESPVKENAVFAWSVISGPATVTPAGVLVLDESAAIGDTIVVNANLDGYDTGSAEIAVIA